MILSEIIEIKTNRLLLRQWRSRDFDSFARINANKSVMAYYPAPMTRQQSDEFANNIQKRISKNKWVFWAVEIPEVCDFIGFVGLNRPVYDLPFEAGIEIGWRLSDQYWGKGYATEAAQAALSVGFNRLNLTEIVAFASVLNTASINVMKRLHMQDTQYLFDHPKIPDGHKLREHCLYKINSQSWKTI
jgi:ribosomal-protein-alanine N-acetyltransferase